MNLGRWYFALQAVAGTAWWAAVFLVPAVRTATLGSLNPIAVAVADVPFFVIASALAAAAGSVCSAFLVLRGRIPTEWVIAGPYRYVRNPMAISGIVQGAAVGLIMGSWLVVVYAVLGSAVWNWVVRPHEEADLAARFGDEFTRYRQRVRCWVPRLRMPLPRQKTEDLA